jgi:uncharacterized membrane protein YuzA (DUF378 family)
MKMKLLDVVALVLLVVGGLNWGLVALGTNLVETIFGSMPWLVSVIYLLVGISAIYVAVMAMKMKNKY